MVKSRTFAGFCLLAAAMAASGALAQASGGRQTPDCGVNPYNRDCTAKTPVDPNLSPRAGESRLANPLPSGATPYVATPGPYKPNPPQGSGGAPGSGR